MKKTEFPPVQIKSGHNQWQLWIYFVFLVFVHPCPLFLLNCPHGKVHLFSEIFIKTRTLSLKKMRLKISFVKWRPFCPAGDELTLALVRITHYIHSKIWDEFTYLFPNMLPLKLGNG